jgi:glycosyltransferase involved in cell wall biosynthesis
MLNRFFYWRIRITYGLTVCNEALELERLLSFLIEHKDRRDEIVVLQDVTTIDNAVTDVINRYKHNLIWRQSRLNGDFAAFKNQLIDIASGDYMFQIDADEVPGLDLMKPLKKTLAKQHKIDCFAVPRINYVEGLTTAYATQRSWQLSPDGRVNFPDYQLRLFRLGCNIQWRNPVHEQLVGQQTCHFLPAYRDDLCLMHRKTLSRQIQQNNLYDSLQS